jgi:hypothetical protein
LRLFIAVILLLLSLLVIVRAPTNFLWLADAVVTSFPYVFMLLAAVLFLSAFYYEKFRWFILLCSLIAFILYALPVVTVYCRGKYLSKELSNIFPSSSTNDELKKPFSFLKMFTGIGIHNIQYQTITYKILDEKS